MDVARLLVPFLAAPLTDAQLAALATYLDLLLRWNSRINLTAVRQPEEIVTRHFGESLYAASRLLTPHSRLDAIDLGSGAGFPGLPLKIYAPHLRLTLIESQNKKATFLKEVVRALSLPEVEVFAGRAETYPARRADLVTLRAVERFESALPLAASLLAEPAPSPLPSPDPRITEPTSRELSSVAGSSGARLALLIGAPQADRARTLLPHLHWAAPLPIPGSSARVLLVGHLCPFGGSTGL
jgi:16S rRNA (guanine527-N7)-methyltransferase